MEKLHFFFQILIKKKKKMYQNWFKIFVSICLIDMVILIPISSSVYMNVSCACVFAVSNPIPLQVLEQRAYMALNFQYFIFYLCHIYIKQEICFKYVNTRMKNQGVMNLNFGLPAPWVKVSLLGKAKKFRFPSNLMQGQLFSQCLVCVFSQ